MIRALNDDQPWDDPQYWNGYEIYDLIELGEFIHGAPHLIDNTTMNKILDTDKVVAEDNGNSLIGKAVSQTSGVCIRIRTNSRDILLCAGLVRKYCYERLMLSSSSGFDVYLIENGKYIHLDTVSIKEPYSYFITKIPLSFKECNDLVIYFPTYNSLKFFKLGIQKSAFIKKCPYKYDKSIIFYGNSCTQGGGSSRSGNAYPNIISRTLDCEIINYSFNASCRGEQSVATQMFIPDNCCAIVVDYQFNSSLDELKQRYGNFIKKLIQLHPGIPIIAVTTLMNEEYDNVIINEISKIDEKIHVVNLIELFSDMNPMLYTVDGVHYTDVGSHIIADHIIKIIENISRGNDQ